MQIIDFYPLIFFGIYIIGSLMSIRLDSLIAAKGSL